MRTKSPLLRLAASMLDLQHRSKVAAKLVMYDDEASTFWPVYAKYEADLKSLNDTFIELAERYDTCSGDQTQEQAWVFLEAFRSLETKRGHLVRKYAAELFGACRGTLIANWIQLEDEIAEKKKMEVSRWSKTKDQLARELNTLSAMKARAELTVQHPKQIAAEFCDVEA